MSGKVRVRFAPSPTGYLHLGVAHTGLFNWLFARNQGGVFILRIEDTDTARSTEESMNAIKDGMRWIGMDWDEGPDVGGDYGPYFQMQRLDIYRKYGLQLIREGKAYRCYCTKEELEEKRREAIKRKKPPKYDGTCRNLTPEQIEANEAKGKPYVVRFKLPEEEREISFDDIIVGKVTFNSKVLDDFVLLKSNGTPIYNFANVIDDYLMKITHIIRAEQHISNTPRQLLLYEALGFEPPLFVHIPHILGKDRSKLSKRHGATSVTWYRDNGYLPEAMVNYLALLSWSPGNERELFSIDELIELFSLDKISKSPAIFDATKLEWMNGQYIKQMPIDKLALLAIPYLKEKFGLDYTADDPELREVLNLMHDRIKFIHELGDYGYFFFTDDFDFDNKAQKQLKKEGVPSLLRKLKERFEALDSFDEECVERATRGLIDELGIKAGALIHPTRAAVTGTTIGPSLFELLAVVGKERTIARLERGADFAEKLGG